MTTALLLAAHFRTKYIFLITDVVKLGCAIPQAFSTARAIEMKTGNCKRLNK